MADSVVANDSLILQKREEMDGRLASIRKAQRAVDDKIHSQLAEIELLSEKLRQVQQGRQQPNSTTQPKSPAESEAATASEKTPENPKDSSAGTLLESVTNHVAQPEDSAQWSRFFADEPITDEPEIGLDSNDSRLQSQMGTLQSEIDGGEAELAKAASLMQRLQDRARKTAEAEQKRNDEVIAAANRENENAELKTLLAKVTRQRIDCETELNELRRDHDSLLDDCEQKMTRIQALITHSKHLDKSESQKAKALNETTAELLKLRAVHEALKHESEKQKNQIDALCTANERLAELEQTTAAQLSERDKELSECEGHMHQLSQMFQQQSDHVDLLTQTNEQLNGQLDTTSDSLQSQSETLCELQSAHERLQQEAEKSAEMVDSLMAENKSLGEECELKTQSLRKTKRELDQLREAHDQLEQDASAQVARINSLLAEKDSLFASDREKARQLEDRDSELESLRAAHETLLAESVQQAERIQFLIDERRQLLLEKSESESLSYANLQAAARDYAQLESEKNRLEQRVAQLVGEDDHPVIYRMTADHHESMATGDDLTRVDGIGPKIQELLTENSIISFEELATTSIEELHAILIQAGGTFCLHDPTSWPQQARYAAGGDWAELSRFQDALADQRRAA